MFQIARKRKERAPKLNWLEAKQSRMLWISSAGRDRQSETRRRPVARSRFVCVQPGKQRRQRPERQRKERNKRERANNSRVFFFRSHRRLGFFSLLSSSAPCPRASLPPPHSLAFRRMDVYLCTCVRFGLGSPACYHVCRPCLPPIPTHTTKGAREPPPQ